VKHYSISPQAVEDLFEIWRYIALDDEEAAEKGLSGFFVTSFRHDVAPDGKRFLMFAPGAAPSPITVVLNRQAGLKK